MYPSTILSGGAIIRKGDDYAAAGRTVPYYSILNERIDKRRFGKNHSAKCLKCFFDFREIEGLQYLGDGDLLRTKILEAGKSLN